MANENWWERTQPGLGAGGYADFGSQFGAPSPATLARAGGGSPPTGGSAFPSVFDPQAPQGFNIGQGTIPTGGGGGNWWDKAIGKGGWAGPALGAAQAGVGFYLGQKGLKLGEEQLKTSKQQFASQFDIQKQELNRQIRETGERRYARDPQNNPDPATYYEQNKIQ